MIQPDYETRQEQTFGIFNTICRWNTTIIKVGVCVKSKPIRFSVLLSVILLIVSPVVISSQTCIQNFAPKPPSGFNSFDSYRSLLSEDKAYALIDVMAEKYLPFGYEYFVMDAGWYSTMNLERHQNLELESFGVCVVRQAYFPNGIKVLADYAHHKGLKFGIWIMCGIPRRAVEQNPPSGGRCIPQVSNAIRR